MADGNLLVDLELPSNRFGILRALLLDNIKYFETSGRHSSQKFQAIFSDFLVHLNAVEVEISGLALVVHSYDFDSDTPGNGYRSFITIVDTCVGICTELCRSICNERQSFTFRRKWFRKEIEAYCHVMSGLKAIFKVLQSLRSACESGNLYPSYDSLALDGIYVDLENVDASCFYGRCTGFQYDQSLWKPLKFVALMMTTFSAAYYNTGGKIPRLFSALVSYCRYSRHPKDLAQCFVKVTNRASVDFCKVFWNLQNHKILQKLSAVVRLPLATNKLIVLPPVALRMPKDDGTFVDIPIPTSHIPTSHVTCRLISTHIREGQLDVSEGTKVSPGLVKPASPYLIIHCHGGGYITKSSTSHKIYLREWAMMLDCPILCIYHSLAPEAPYPRALEEGLYAYSWAVQNCRSLGCTGERICLVGGSAAGHLMMGVLMKAIQYGIRLPDGFLCIYPVLSPYFVPSPSHLLCLLDPVLPLEFAILCFKATAMSPLDASSSENEPEVADSKHTRHNLNLMNQNSKRIFADRSLNNETSFKEKVDQLNAIVSLDDYFLSPCLTPDKMLLQFPPIRFVTTCLDPFLDEAVMLAKRLRKLDKDVDIDVLGNILHGFLNFTLVSPAAQEGSDLCIRRLRELLQMPSN